MSNTKLTAVISLIEAAETILSSGRYAQGTLDVYAESVSLAAGHALEFCGALLDELSSPNDPFTDFGTEPLDHAEALELAPSFLKECLEILRGEQRQHRALASMWVRMQTYALLLQSVKKSSD